MEVLQVEVRNFLAVVVKTLKLIQMIRILNALNAAKSVILKRIVLLLLKGPQEETVHTLTVEEAVLVVKMLIKMTHLLHVTNALKKDFITKM